MEDFRLPETTLGELVSALPDGTLTPGFVLREPDRQVKITGITLDSRRVQPGNLFVALVGGAQNGHRYIPEAVERGAAAIAGTLVSDDVPYPYLRFNDGRRGLAELAAAFFGHPARRLVVIGVTGTDGKTTTANLIYSILRASGLAAGMISTVNAVIGDSQLDTGLHVTTPEAPDVQRYLSMMVAAGLTHVVLEATSHGLDQWRVGACDFDVAVVTNITHEHLDYHGDYSAYRKAKTRLIELLVASPLKQHGQPRTAVLNLDDSSFPYLAGVVRELNERHSIQPAVRRLSYGLNPLADWQAGSIRMGEAGLHYLATGVDSAGYGLRFPVTARLVGTYNVANTLAALAVTVGALGVSAQAAVNGLARFSGIPGRMERIVMGQGFTALVDFAHTPNALRRALETGRGLAGAGRVIVVFGSAGLRDRAKRRLMAETAAELADFTVLTAEDPRTESLDLILEEMALGMQAHGGKEGATFWRVADRGAALRVAVSLAQPGDVLLACGKGHEQSMCFGETEYPWDDRIALRAALAESLGLPGYSMPYLPTQG